MLGSFIPSFNFLVISINVSIALSWPITLSFSFFSIFLTSLKISVSSKLIGSPAGYVGYDDDKNILEEIRNYPYSVLIFDEIEKAHSSIINFFLNILDEGYCFDNKGNKIRFDNVLIIMTSNSNISKNSVGFNNTKSISNNFPKEFLKLKRTEKVIRPRKSTRVLRSFLAIQG